MIGNSFVCLDQTKSDIDETTESVPLTNMRVISGWVEGMLGYSVPVSEDMVRG